MTYNKHPLLLVLLCACAVASSELASLLQTSSAAEEAREAEMHQSSDGSSSGGGLASAGGSLALMSLVLETVEAMQALHINSTDIKQQLDTMVTDAAMVQEGYMVMSGQHKLPWQMKADVNMPSIGFIKTHRSAGSSITNILQRIGDARDLAFVLPADGTDLGWPRGLSDTALVGASESRKHQFDIICNHAVYNDKHMHWYLKPGPFLFSILRSPASHMRSIFEERIRSASNFIGYSVQISWEERIEWLNMLWHDANVTGDMMSAVDRATFLNPNSHDLGWYSYVGGTTAFDQDDDRIDEWIHSLSRNMTFMMVTEHFDEGLVLLRKKLGLDIKDVAYLHDSTAAKVQHYEPSGQEAKSIEKLMKVDTKLYSHFNQTFWNEWEEAGGYAAMNSDLQELRLYNKVLLKACSRQNEKLCTRNIKAGNVDYTEHLKKKQSEAELFF